uniref:Immunoglobulin V-set domain-containing protein n=1 Tax=Cyprinus carpio TaxID=7962 RepID=A0A8C1IXR3_CYPCA
TQNQKHNPTPFFTIVSMHLGNLFLSISAFFSSVLKQLHLQVARAVCSCFNFPLLQWTWQNQSSKYQIMVFHMDLGLSMHETPLKDRVSFSRSSPSIDEVSIIIKDVKISDQGVYSCDYTIFPSGSHTGQTTLIVLECNPPVLSTAEAVGIVTAVVIITLVITVVGYLFLRNRRYVTTKHLVNASKYDRFMPTAN